MMRTRLKKKLWLFFALIAAIFALILLPSASPSAAADAASQPYSFTINQFDVSYDVHPDRTIDVEERVTIHYTGYASTGFYRDLPVNAGDRVYNADVKQLNSAGAETDVDYSVEIEDELVILNIGDYSNKTNQTITYVIRYEYAVTRPTSDNALYLNIIGFGSEAAIEESHVTVNLPDGFESANLYIGNSSTAVETFTDDGTNVIEIDLSDLRAFEGATLDMFFADGVLSTRFDITPYIMVIAGCVLLAVLISVKFLAFRKKDLTPVVTFAPPRGMDPVEVSKLIDNKVESADVTTLIYYWASKGYIKIDLSDENDPILIRIMHELPAGSPKHQIVMYNALFMNRDMVKTSELEGRFCTTIERVRKLINEKHTGLYTKKSICASLIFTLLGGLLMVLAPIVCGMAGINASLFYYPAFLALVPAFIVYGVTETYAYSVHKFKSSTRGLMICGVVLLCALFTALYAWLVPSAIIELIPKIIVCIVAYIVIIISVTLITRTDQYNAELNEIIGFRNFILHAEKDRLELMLKDDPEFYYKILPYAQVMGVSDIWEDKFKALTVEPPQWLIDPMGNFVTFALVNRAVRMSAMSFTACMVARPNAPSGRSYSGGGRSGGSFGGHGGGGHGGGGFRGR